MLRAGLFVVACLLFVGGTAVLVAGPERREPPLPLPDRRDPAVAAEEARLEEIVERPGVMFLGDAVDCRVRLLGREGAASFAWAFCQSASGSSSSGPVRVEGDNVRMPADGAGYSVTVKQLFPPDLAERILRHEDELRP